MPAGKEKLIAFICHTQPLLTQEQAMAVADFFSKKELPKNSIPFTEGKMCGEYYYLESGYVRSYTHNLDGEEVTTGLFVPDRVVCDLLSFFKRIPARENYQTLTDCDVWCITFDQLQMAFHSLPAFREFGRALLVNEYASLKVRMLSTLHETAEERYANLFISNPDIFQYVPLKNIASFLGITDTSLSRIRKEFVKKI
jgi:CRP-like cAMP-binding protein